MKVERQPGLHANAQQGVAPATNWSVTGAQRTFETALRRQRQRIAADDRSSQLRTDARSAKSRPTPTAEPGPLDKRIAGTVNERTTPSTHRPRTPLATVDVDDLPSPFIDRALALRWRHVKSTQNTACIEVVHPTTGTRFLLSRQDGVWLLAIQSRASPLANEEDNDALVQALRAHFAEHDLGPVDVVKL